MTWAFVPAYLLPSSKNTKARCDCTVAASINKNSVTINQNLIHIGRSLFVCDLDSKQLIPNLHPDVVLANLMSAVPVTLARGQASVPYGLRSCSSNFLPNHVAWPTYSWNVTARGPYFVLFSSLTIFQAYSHKGKKCPSQAQSRKVV